MPRIKKNSSVCRNRNILFGSSVEYPPFEPHNLHTHERCEIFCVFRGNGYYITEGARNRLEPGRIFLMRPGEMHMIAPMGEAPKQSLAFHFDCSVVDGIDPERRLLAPFFDRPLGMNNIYDHGAVAPTEIYALFQKMREYEGENYDKCVHVTALLFPVLAELKKLFDAKAYSTPSKGSGLMHAVIGYVNDNLTLELSPELLCEKFHFSRAQLDRNFKNTTGSTVWAYITAKRLLLAKSYIEDGMRITEAASACGFKDYSTFYRAYRKHFCTTPSETTDPEDSTRTVFRRL